MLFTFLSRLWNKKIWYYWSNRKWSNILPKNKNMISTSHIVIMLISISALNFANMVQCGSFDTNIGLINGIKCIKISKIINIRHVTLAILFFILLASQNLIVLSVLSAVFFCSILLEFGHRDPARSRPPSSRARWWRWCFC